MESENVGVADLKLAVCRLVDVKTEYAEKKEIAEGFYKQVKEAEARVIELLDLSGLDSFKVPNVGTATRSDKLSWLTPKSITEKKDFFKYIKDKLGDEGFWSYVSINSRTLQTFCKDQIVEGGESSIPGLEAPVAGATLRFTKIRK
jgi:hypothetical protein